LRPKAARSAALTLAAKQYGSLKRGEGHYSRLDDVAAEVNEREARDEHSAVGDAVRMAAAVVDHELSRVLRVVQHRRQLPPEGHYARQVQRPKVGEELLVDQRLIRTDVHPGGIAL